MGGWLERKWPRVRLIEYGEKKVLKRRDLLFPVQAARALWGKKEGSSSRSVDFPP